jgi:hypothetical protein
MAQIQDSSQFIETVYRVLGQLFVLYGDAQPPQASTLGQIDLDIQRQSLMRSIGEMQIAWSRLAKSEIRLDPARQRALQDQWSDLLKVEDRISARLTIWTPWLRRLTVCVAAENRLNNLLNETARLDAQFARLFGELVQSTRIRVQKDRQDISLLRKLIETEDSQSAIARSIYANSSGQT